MPFPVTYHYIYSCGRINAPHGSGIAYLQMQHEFTSIKNARNLAGFRLLYMSMIGVAKI